MKRVQRRHIPIIAVGILLACCSCAYGLNPSLDVNQYAHTAWKISEGFSKGAIFAIAQTPDGYLWLGTEFGLLRFDGVRAVPWQPPPGEQLRTSDIRSLVGARDGRLWIGTFNGLASWKDGKLTHYPELDGQVIEALLEDREGTIWVAGWNPSVGRLCQIQSGNTQCYGEDGRFGAGVNALYEDRAGSLWVGGMTGVWRWKPGTPKLYPMPEPENKIYSLAESDDGILVGKTSGIIRLTNGQAVPYPISAHPQFRVHRFLRDRDGSLWMGAIVDRGLLHVHEGRTDEFSSADGLSGQSVSSLFEDREGNIWVATLDGLDRFRDFAVPKFSVQQGLSSRGVDSVLAAADGSLWLGTSDGLTRWDKEQITIYRRHAPPMVRGNSAASRHTAGTMPVREVTDGGLPDSEVNSLFQDNLQQIWVGTQNGIAVFKSGRFFPLPSVPRGLVYAIAAHVAGDVWVSHQEGLFHFIQERLVERIPWAQLGRREPATALVNDALQGGYWLGFRDGGVAYFNDGRLGESYGRNEGLAEGIVNHFHVDRDGALWVATDGGLSRIKDGHVLTLSSRSGLPCDTVHWIMEDDADTVWLHMACGLVRFARSELGAWVSHTKQTISLTVFDTSDGVSNHRINAGYSPLVTKAADGRVWFLPFGGVGVIDPHHLSVNKIPPPVHIEQIVADGKTYDTSQGLSLSLPPLVRDLAIDFTALSFVAPEKVRFRYMLEGQDPDWKEVVNNRQAQYSNLGPGHYRFRVMACNNSGVWNEAGALLDFSIAPSFYQTLWFRGLCVLAFITLLFAAYQLRVRQLAYQFNRTLEARVSERTRIARDLHDTLLQSFHGLLLRFQSVSNVLPGNPQEAKRRLDLAVDQAAAAITEGRNAVQGLRSSAFETNDLAAGIIALGQEFTGDDPSAIAPVIDVVVEGATRTLNPIVRDEAYRIAGEALRNAVRHAQARHISIEIRYDWRQFRLLVRDDGKGIDEATVRQGHAGHFGLPGMRERAEIVRGRLEIWTKRDEGTQVELSVPAVVAYGASDRRSWYSKVFTDKTRKNESTQP